MKYAKNKQTYTDTDTDTDTDTHEHTNHISKIRTIFSIVQH